jgi:hypothetical protein
MLLLLHGLKLLVLVAISLLVSSNCYVCQAAGWVPPPQHASGQYATVAGCHHHMLNNAWFYEDTGTFIHLKPDGDLVRLLPDHFSSKPASRQLSRPRKLSSQPRIVVTLAVLLLFCEMLQAGTYLQADTLQQMHQAKCFSTCLSTSVHRCIHVLTRKRVARMQCLHKWCD